MKRVTTKELFGAAAALVLLAALLAAPLASPLGAAEPTEGKIGPPPTATSVSWKGKPDFSDPDPFNAAGSNIDSFFLTVSGPGRVEIAIGWQDPLTDLDLYVFPGRHPGGSNVGQVAQSDGAKATPGERVSFTAAAGEYTVKTSLKSGVDGTYEGTATFVPHAVFDDETELTFGPASIVSAHFLGTEPMTTIEREMPGFEGATDPDRMFVDWPLSPRTQTGQLSRSLDGGDTFHLLFDRDCAERNRPTCSTGGGSDTFADVNLFTGTLYFSDQEYIFQESLSSSTDHGDSFPESRQHIVTNATTVTDRQWVAPTDAGSIHIPDDRTPDPSDRRVVEAFLAYHVPREGQFIQGIDMAGAVIPQPAPQVPDVIQSGPIRVDTNKESPGRGWIYEPVWRGKPNAPDDSSEIHVITAKGEDYRDPTKWRSNFVSDHSPVIFVWLDIDSAGNAYVVWVNVEDYAVYYSASPIHHTKNNPKVGGRPGTHWLPPVRISPPEVGTAIFPEVVAGDSGRIGIAYDGTAARSDDGPGVLPAGTEWNTYAAVITNALRSGSDPPVVTTGIVNHRVIHTGQICPDGAFCSEGDSSFADMIDLAVDQEGRLGVTFTDNNSTLGSPNGRHAAKGRPFVHFAKQVSGPSLLAGEEIDVTIPTGPRSDPVGDARWPHTEAEGRSLFAADLLGASLSLEGDDLVARIPLSSASADARIRDLTSYNSVPLSNAMTNNRKAARLQYVLRFSTATEIYHLSMESLANGTLNSFGGRLDANDALEDTVGVLGAGYHADPTRPVRGQIEGNTIVLRARASDFGLGGGAEVYSVTGFAMAGPTEAEETASGVFDTMRTIDATPPYDAALVRQPSPSPSSTPTFTPTPAVSTTPDPSTSPTGSPADPEPEPEPEPEAPQGKCDIVGSAASDLLEGTDGDDVICGLGGNDVILGFTGDDRIKGGAGNDRMFGSVGDDVILGGAGSDEMRGGQGRDALHGGAGPDLLSGGSGNDELRGLRGGDRLDGRAGRDLCRGGRGRDRKFACER